MTIYCINKTLYQWRKKLSSKFLHRVWAPWWDPRVGPTLFIRVHSTTNNLIIDRLNTNILKIYITKEKEKWAQPKLAHLKN